ncbi:MAG TPA: hypothetical protein VMC42_07935 [Methanoregulaceae archaeon]|nr:hypothetical protein [Methanoregulaceae archaeon]
MKSLCVGAGVLLAVVFLVSFTGTAYADRNVPAPPEIQGLATGTGMNVQGTIIETDSGAWSVNVNGIPISGDDPFLASYPRWADTPFENYTNFKEFWDEDSATFPGEHLQDLLNWFAIPGNTFETAGPWANDLLTWLQGQGSSLDPPLQDQEIQYTSVYNDQMMAVSGQSVFAKSIAVTTANTIAAQSNIRADTGVQFIGIDTGRATRTEDLLVDGAAQASNTSDAILCPFVTSVSSLIPAYCNIGQSGSSFDTSLASVVTHADDRFVGTDSAFPVILSYNIAAEGITAGNRSSPMIGSVSAYLNVHVQEARNASSQPLLIEGFTQYNTLPPLKSEDLVYSGTSSASGLITKFGKSMSYQSGSILL